MSSNLKVNTILPSVGSNIGLGTNGGNLNVDGGCKVQVGTALTLGHTVGVQFATQNLHTAGFEVNQINASGIITASQFKGDGSQLTGISAGTSLSGSTNNTVCTVTGANAIQGESNLTFDGTNLSIAGSSTGNPLGLTIKNTNTAAYSHARLRLESQNASKYADIFCDVPNDCLRLAYNSSNSIYLSEEGNVGLGTATPQNSSGYATLTVSGSTGGQIAFFGGTRRHFIWANSSGNLNIGGGYIGGGDVRIFTNGNNERVRFQNDGHVSLRNSANSHQELQWYVNTTKSASIGWGNGSANWEFKHFRNDNQADNPYANIDFFTGDFSNPTRALRITNDGNHIREKHSRFATRINYASAYESAHAKLDFRDPHVNVGGDFNASNERFTAPVDGDYAFWFHTNVEKSGGGSYYATWYKNGSEANGSHGGRMYDQHSGSGWNNLSGCIMLNLSEGDYVEVYNGGQSVNYDGNSYGQFMGWLVG
jgi:hypothetical protein